VKEEKSFGAVESTSFPVTLIRGPSWVSLRVSCEAPLMGCPRDLSCEALQTGEVFVSEERRSEEK
jgi:hypothetical protein